MLEAPAAKNSPLAAVGQMSRTYQSFTWLVERET